MSQKVELFREVHHVAQTHLGALIEALLEMLKRFGAAPGGTRKTFGVEIRKVLVLLATCEEDESPLANIRLEGTIGEKRHTLIKEVLVGFGADDDDASSMAQSVLSTDPNLLGIVGKFGLRVRHHDSWNALTSHVSRLHSDARDLHERLTETLAEINEAYRGTADDPEDGVEQVVELLQRFPDVAEVIYEKAGLTGLKSFPPQAQGAAGPKSRLFASEVEEYIDGEWWWDVFKVAGLIVAAVAVTIVTAGTLGPLAATLVGGSIGLAQGGVGVYVATERLQDTRDAQRYDAASEARIEHAEGEVVGAWGMLVANLATAGMIGRFGGTQAMSALVRTSRVTTISAAGGGVATATNPNVWRAENTGSLILFGTVIAGVGGAGGMAVAGAAGRLVRPLGARVQIGVSKIDGELKSGRTVKVQLRAGEPPVNAKVVSTNARDNTVMLTVEGKNLHVRVGRLAKVEAGMLDDAAQAQGLRQVTEADLNPRLTSVFLSGKGQNVPGMVSRGRGGELLFHGLDGSQPQKVQLGDLRLYDAAKHAKAAGVPLKDLEGFSGNKGDFEVTPVADRSGYYAARPTAPTADRPRLFVVTGKKHDHNGAFNGWQHERLPNFNMRGRGPAPAPEEVALFMAHGAPTGFAGIGTRRAARTIVDAIINANRASAGGAQARIRFCSLSSCSQGTRRFLVLGKTNAQAFQEHVDIRLREFGIDPRGPQGVTVLASDRMGSLYGADSVKVLGKFRTTSFVPAGQQRPLSYGADVGQMSLRVGGFVVVVGGLQGVMILAIEAVRDPEGMMEWINANKDKVLGVLMVADE